MSIQLPPAYVKKLITTKMILVYIYMVLEPGSNFREYYLVCHEITGLYRVLKINE